MCIVRYPAASHTAAFDQNSFLDSALREAVSIECRFKRARIPERTAQATVICRPSGTSFGHPVKVGLMRLCGVDHYIAILVANFRRGDVHALVPALHS